MYIFERDKSALFPFSSESRQKDLDHWLITGTLGGSEGTFRRRRGLHAHVTKSALARTERDEVEPPVAKSQVHAIRHSSTFYAICTCGW